MGDHGDPVVPPPPGLYQWKRGVEPPPFICTNPAAVSLCENILAGNLETLPAIFMSEAIAVQVYRLVFDRDRRAESLKDIGIGGVYVILATLARRALAPADAAAAKRLKDVLARKPGSASRTAPGLDTALRAKVGRRDRDPDIPAGMQYEEATTHVLKLWDLLPLNFDFGMVSSGGGGGDPGGGGSGSVTGDKAPAAPMFYLSQLDPRTQALNEGLGMKAACCLRAANEQGDIQRDLAILRLRQRGGNRVVSSSSQNRQSSRH